MDSNQKFWISFFSIVGALAIAIALIIAAYNYKVEIAAMDKGYQKVTIPYGLTEVYQKVNDND